MRRGGLSDEQIEEIIAVDRIPPHGLWPENLLPVDIALRCHWERALGAMGGQIWQGVRLVEIEAALRVLRVPPDERWTVLGQVRHFVNVVCNELNHIEAQRAQEKKA